MSYIAIGLCAFGAILVCIGIAKILKPVGKVLSDWTEKSETDAIDWNYDK